MWVIKFVCVVLGLACFVFGPIAVYKGFHVTKSGSLRNLRQTKAGGTLLVVGIVLSLLGLMLFYFPFTF